MTRDEAKKIKFDFVNITQEYNGYEIADMWNMMCDQLFNELDNKKCINCKFARFNTDLKNDVWCNKENGYIYDINIYLDFYCPDFIANK